MAPLLLLLAAAPRTDLLPADAGVRLINVDAPKAARLVFESDQALAVLDGQAVLVQNACLDVKAHARGAVLVLAPQNAPEPSADCKGKVLAPEGEYPIGTIGQAKFLGHAPFAYAGELSLAPNAEVKPHQHDGSDEIVLIESGSGTFTVGDQPRKVSAGDAMWIPRGTRHAFVAGAQAVKAIQFYAPPGPEERFKILKK